MSLQEFLASLTNADAVVTVLESDDSELIKMYASGYAYLLAELLARTVKHVTVANPKAITVKLEETT